MQVCLQIVVFYLQTGGSGRSVLTPGGGLPYETDGDARRLA